jgi:hypothetical protein
MSSQQTLPKWVHLNSFCAVLQVLTYNPIDGEGIIAGSARLEQRKARLSGTKFGTRVEPTRPSNLHLAQKHV